MNKIKKEQGLCSFCEKVTYGEPNLIVYRLAYCSNLGEYSEGITNITDALSKYLFKRGSHLSATQVILLRPDIFLEFLKSKYDTVEEKISRYNLIEAEACPNCFKEYKQEVPEK